MMPIMRDMDPDGFLQRARSQAATLGAFDPSRLLNPAHENQLAALDKLATECDEVLDDGNALWMLNPDARTQTLREMPSSELSATMRSVQPATGDRLGQLLREVLSGAPVNGQGLGMQELGLLRTALHFASAARDTAEAVREVDRLLVQRDAEEAIQALLPRRLVGRGNQLAKLRRFADEEPGIAAENVMWITGAGGSGKSALLAKFADSLRGSMTPIICIDFDRPALFSGSLTTLMMEVSRQLEVLFPAMEPDLSNYRRMVRSAEAAQTDPAQFEQRQAKAHRSSSAWQECMARHLPIESDIVFILDTAEEVGLSSEFDLEALRRWLRELRTRDGLPNLKAVLCGRAFDEDQLALVRSSHRIELDDLPPRAAVSLLRMYMERQGVEGDFPLDELVDMLGGNPLMLKILAAYLGEGGVPAAQSLLADRKDFDRRFAQSFLYKRILRRLHNASEDLKNLAHPGLVLRRVTPHLIEHVLAGPCKLGDIGHERARDLFRRLAGQVWLVQRTMNPDAVIHRRDLRRLMLQAMTAQDEPTALAIHTAAAAYYLEGMDPVLTRQEQQVEGQYHRLFIPGAPLPQPEVLEAFARALGEDLDSVPVPARARIKLELGRKLTATELQALSGNEHALYQSGQERKEVLATGVAARAMAGPVRVERSDSRDLRVAISELQAAFEQGDLKSAALGTASAVADFASAAAHANTKFSSEDFTQSAVWRCAIATMTHDPDPLTAALLGTVDELRSSRVWDGAVNGPWLGKLSPANAYQMLFRIHGADCPENLLPWRFGDPSSRLSVTQDLRNFQLRDKKPDESLEVEVRLLRDVAPAFMTYFKDRVVQHIRLDAEAYMDLGEQVRLHSKAARVTLNDLERLGERNGSVLILDMEQIDSEAKDVLVGRVPEIYPLVRAAARASKVDTLIAFASAASQEHPLWPVELSRDRLAPALASQREQWTATLIACVDRFGLLRGFVDWMEDRNRLPRRHRHLLQTVRDYELRIRQFI